VEPHENRGSLSVDFRGPVLYCLCVTNQFEITIRFDSGALRGIETVRPSAVARDVGQCVKCPCGGGSSYTVLACQRVAS
jgi:hypothetical protein